ncbi:MAG: hypothetical protein JRI80_00135 [Deltaproteobacteria bacterium]|nr:hypothetical protein [Deltaproteobacteria bacterium]
MAQALTAAIDIGKHVIAEAIGLAFFGDPEADSRKPDRPDVGKPRKPPKPNKDYAGPLVFPDEIPLVTFGERHAAANDRLVARLRRLLSEHGEPTYESISDKDWKGIQWADLIHLWTPHRQELSRDSGRLYRAVASLSTIWSYYMANPEADRKQLVKVYMQRKLKADDITEAGFYLLLDHVLDYVKGSAI